MDQAAELAAILIETRADLVPADLKLDAWTRLIWIDLHRGRHQSAAVAADAAIEMACLAGDRVREAIARSFYARVLCEMDEIKNAADQAVLAVELARATDRKLPQSMAFSILSVICAPLGLYDAATEMSREAVGFAELSGDTEALIHALINDGSIYADNLFRHGSGTAQEKQAYLELGVAQTRRAYQLALADDDGEMTRLAGFNLAEFLLMAGDVTQAEAILRAAEADLQNASRRCSIHHAHIATLLQMAHGNIHGAIAALQKSIEDYIAYPFMELAVYASEYLSNALAKVGDYKGAYFELKRFHALEQRFSDKQNGSYLQSALIRDQITELRTTISTERERSETLTKVHAALQEEADHLLKVSFEDPLTCIGNRRKMNVVISELRAANDPYAIAILDLDNFKSINDRFSHMTGDEVLKSVASIICTVLAELPGNGGVAIRLGGEEFAVILMTPPNVDVLATCETLREAIEDYHWTAIAESLRVTTSIGFALSSEATEESSCLNIADARLYHAKQTGRNRVVARGLPQLALASLLPAAAPPG